MKPIRVSIQSEADKAHAPEAAIESTSRCAGTTHLKKAVSCFSSHVHSNFWKFSSVNRSRGSSISSSPSFPICQPQPVQKNASLWKQGLFAILSSLSRHQSVTTIALQSGWKHGPMCSTDRSATRTLRSPDARSSLGKLCRWRPPNPRR